MGVVLWPMFNPEVPSIDVQLEGKALAGSVPFLDDLARLLNVRTISSFMDNRPLPDGVGEPPPIGDPAKLGQLDDWIAGFEAAEAEREEREPWSEWFPAADGAETMHALARRLESRVDAVPAKMAVAAVIKDLDELARCLLLAEARGARFRLDVF